MEVKRSYEQRGPAGRRLYSYRDLAKMFGVSETTILRTIRGLGSFMALPTPGEQDALKAEAAASLKKLMAGTPPTDTAVTTKGEDDGLTDEQRKQLASYGHGPKA